jgi:hypothetical protein
METGRGFSEARRVVALRDQRLYEFTCQAGHENRIVLQQPTFDILAEVAVQAIADGYLREAVSSAAAALERFYEFYIRVVHAHRNGEEAGFKAAWKLVSSQSERQLGMYVATYLAETGEAPTLLKTKMVELRNNVVHKGQIPGIEEATAFVQAVTDVIFEVLPGMQIRYPEGVRDVHAQELEAAVAEAGDEVTGSYAQHLVFPLAPTGDEKGVDVAAAVQARLALREGEA